MTPVPPRADPNLALRLEFAWKLDEFGSGIETMAGLYIGDCKNSADYDDYTLEERVRDRTIAQYIIWLHNTELNRKQDAP